MELPRLAPIKPDQLINFATPKSWGISDPARFNALMEEAKSLVTPGYYLGDNLFTWGRNNSLFEDVAFRQAWTANIQNDADQAIAWRRYVLACLAYNCLPLPGDFVECGVYAGSGIKTVMDYLGGKDFPKPFWGYDTFDYNPVQGHSFAGQAEGFYHQIKARFDGYPQVRLIQGFIPDSFAQGMPEKIAYRHIDMNNAAGEIAALDNLFERVVSGGVIVLDDYEWSIYRGQKQAEDPWFEARGYRVVPLPTGQGMLIKR
jgi:O-methyltransferase